VCHTISKNVDILNISFVILAAPEAEIRKITSQGEPGQKVSISMEKKHGSMHLSPQLWQKA
jgi:hypothetical protein